jgi:hypothetical protein
VLHHCRTEVIATLRETCHIPITQTPFTSTIARIAIDDRERCTTRFDLAGRAFGVI